MQAGAARGCPTAPNIMTNRRPHGAGRGCMRMPHSVGHYDKPSHLEQGLHGDAPHSHPNIMTNRRPHGAGRGCMRMPHSVGHYGKPSHLEQGLHGDAPHSHHAGQRGGCCIHSHQAGAAGVCPTQPSRKGKMSSKGASQRFQKGVSNSVCVLCTSL